MILVLLEPLCPLYFVFRIYRVGRIEHLSNGLGNYNLNSSMEKEMTTSQMPGAYLESKKLVEDQAAWGSLSHPHRTPLYSKPCKN